MWHIADIDIQYSRYRQDLVTHEHQQKQSTLTYLVEFKYAGGHKEASRESVSSSKSSEEVI